MNSGKKNRESEISSPTSSVTWLLGQIQNGNAAAEDLLWERVYDEIRQLSLAMLTTDGDPNSISPESLAHEAYLRITSNEALLTTKNRRHLIRLLGRAMRQVLADRARRRRVRGTRLAIDAVLDSLVESRIDATELREALDALESNHQRAAEVVTLRFFFQESIASTAALLGVSESTVESDWRFAQAWLYRRLHSEDF